MVINAVARLTKGDASMLLLLISRETDSATKPDSFIGGQERVRSGLDEKEA